MPESQEPPFPPPGLNQLVAPGDAPRVEDLQFEQADFSGQSASTCSLCRGGIGESYYHVDGAVTCPACATARQALQGRPPGRAVFLRAALFGLGAAIAGAIVYALVLKTGFAFGIVAILVGYIVGKAIRHVTKGRSSRRYQVLAVALTYFSITSAYVPYILSGLITKMEDTKTTTQASAPSQPAKAQPTTSLTEGLIALAVMVVVLVGLALGMPFIVVFENPVSGLINLVIIGIGLNQAWKLTQANEAVIAGPYAAPKGAE